MAEEKGKKQRKGLYKQRKVFEACLHTLLGLLCVWVPYIYRYEYNIIGLFVGCLVFVHFWVTAVKYVSKVVGEALSNWLYSNGVLDRRPLASRSQMLKWQDQSWQWAIHVTMTCAEVYVLWDEPMWYKDQMFLAWDPHPNEQYKVMKPSMKVLYILQLAIWIYTCFMHAMEPVRNRRKDYHMMYVHHLVTILLVAGSASCNYYRIGLLVLYIHDASDIFIDTMKMANYVKCDGPKAFYIVEISFVANLIAWVYFRLYLYPFYVIHSALFGGHTLLGNTPEPGNIWKYPFIENVPWYLHLSGLLMILVVMHVFWFYILLKILVKIVLADRKEASRSEYEGESSDEEEEEPEKEQGAKQAETSTEGQSAESSEAPVRRARRRQHTRKE